MKNTKKVLSLVLALAMMLALASCGGTGTTSGSDAGSARIGEKAATPTASATKRSVRGWMKRTRGRSAIAWRMAYLSPGSG